MNKKIKSPFKVSCNSGLSPSKTYTFANMMDTDRKYYYLNGDIGNIRINRYDDNSKYGYVSRFQDIVKSEKFYLEKFNVIPVLLQS